MGSGEGGQPLTDDQRTQIKEIMETTGTQLKPTILELKTNRRALRDLIISGTPTEAQIKTQVDAMVPIGTAIAEQRALAFNQVVTKVLTDAQRNVLQQFKAQKAQ